MVISYYTHIRSFSNKINFNVFQANSPPKSFSIFCFTLLWIALFSFFYSLFNLIQNSDCLECFCNLFYNTYARQIIWKYYFTHFMIFLDLIFYIQINENLCKKSIANMQQKLTSVLKVKMSTNENMQ